MQNGYAKAYLYVLVAISAANLLLGILYVSTKNVILAIPLTFFLFAELVVFIMSIMMIVKVFTKKLNRINLILPVFYLVTVIMPGAYDESFLDTFDLSSTYNLIMFFITVAEYSFQIGFAIYLLRNDEFFRQGDE